MDTDVLIEAAEEADADVLLRSGTFGDNLARVQRRLWNVLQDHVNEYQTLQSKTSRKRLVANTRININLAAGSFQVVQQALHDEGYHKEARRFVSGYDDLKRFLGKSFEEMDLPVDFKARDLDAMKVLKSHDLIKFAGVGEEVSRRISRVLFDSVVHRVPVDALRQSLETMTVGDERQEGLLRQHAGSYAPTAMMAFNRAMHDRAAEAAGLDRFVYLGPLDVVTRPFCAHHVGLVFTRDQISEMRNGQIEPVIQYGGGFRCRHHWQPVPTGVDKDLDASVVPEEAEPEEVTAGSRKITVYRSRNERPLLNPAQRKALIGYADIPKAAKPAA